MASTDKAGTDKAGTDRDAALLAKAQQQVLAGVVLVMGGVVFGGGTAMALHLVGMRPAAMIVAGVAGVLVVLGIAVQVVGAGRLKAGKSGGEP